MNKTTSIMASIVITACVLMPACTPSQEEIKSTMAMLTDPMGRISKPAQEKLGKMGAAAVPEIMKFCRDVEEPVEWTSSLKRVAACDVLGTYFRNEPEGVSGLLELTSSKDGMLKQKAIYHVRYCWGDEVEKELSQKIVNALVDVIKNGNQKMEVHKYITSNEKGRGQVYIYQDFDITAVESLSVMYGLHKNKAPRWADLCKHALELALEYPRVQEKARKALTAR